MAKNVNSDYATPIAISRLPPPPTKNGTLHGETHTDSLLFLIVVISLAMAKAQLIPKIMFNAKEQ